MDSRKSISYVVMLYGASNVQLGGEFLYIYYRNISVMRWFEHTVSLFFNDVSKIPVLNQIVTPHKAIYKLFGSVIYHKPFFSSFFCHISQTSLYIEIKNVWISK